MEWVETTGRTVAQALDTALDELGVDEADVEYEVLAEAKSGFLGIGSSEARIRARVRPISREKPGERQRRRGGRSQSRSRDSRSSGRRSGRSGSDAVTATVDDVATDSALDNATSNGEAGGPDGSGDGAAGSGNGRSSSRRRRGGRGGARNAGSGADGGRHETRPRGEERGGTVDTIERDVPIDEQAEAAQAFTQGLVDAFEVGAEVHTSIDDDAVLVEVEGDNLGLLVGPKGATLHAIEELVRTVVQRQTDGHGVRINVDVAGYRAKRRAALEDFTRNLAEKVLATGRAQALEPMSAADRKVVHDTAAEIAGVLTESEGEDPRRRVVLRPA